MSLYNILDPRTTLPAGEYYIGDPCYVLPDSEWMQALEETRYFGLFATDEDARAGQHKYQPKHLMNGVFSKLGHLFAVSSTAYGDGSYRVEDEEGLVDYDTRCGVDAGMIAAIPMALVDQKEVDKYNGGIDYLGCRRKFDEPFTIKYSDGKITFGPVSVITGDEEGW